MSFENERLYEFQMEKCEKKFKLFKLEIKEIANCN